MTDVPQPPFQAEWRVILNDGSNAVKIVPVPRTGLLIGRAVTANLHLDDGRVSRHHARLLRQGDQLFIEDLQTVNGTSVNGQPLNQPMALQPNDVISLGPFTLIVEQSLVPITPSRQETRAYPRPRRLLPGLLLAAGLISLLIIGLLCWGLYGYWFTWQETSLSTRTGPTLTVSQAPATNSTVSLNQPITVQALASDASGVTRVELWANGRKVDEVDTQLVEVAPTLNAALQWQASRPGPLVLEVRAYNSAGQVSIQSIANLTVVGQPDTPTPSLTPSSTIVPLLPTAIPSPTPTDTPNPTPTTTPSPTPTPVPATPTPSSALLTLSVPALNVRAGPGTQYGLIGQLAQGTPTEIIGRSSAAQGQWWQIHFADGPGGVGWVSAAPTFGTASNIAAVPIVSVPTPQLSAVSIPVTPTPLPTPSTTAPTPASQVIRAPAGKTLLIASNRSMAHQPALLTLSGGEWVGGGHVVDTPAGGEVQLVLEPDFYHATWSSPGPRGGFANNSEFSAVANKIIVMWIVPEQGRAATEVYDELNIGRPTPTPIPTPIGTATPGPIRGSYPGAPEGKAVFVAANRTLDNSYAVLTLSGGGFGGGKEIKLDAGVEIPLELLPGYYRAVWTSPTHRSPFSAGREFQVSAGEVILSWIIPDQGQVFIQFPGQEPEQINH